MKTRLGKMMAGAAIGASFADVINHALDGNSDARWIQDTQAPAYQQYRWRQNCCIIVGAIGGALYALYNDLRRKPVVQKAVDGRIHRFYQPPKQHQAVRRDSTSDIPTIARRK